MLRKIISSLVAFSMLTVPVSTASAENYIFRYKSPLMVASAPAETYGLGNDIVAWYVAPIGYDFLKKIPVATQDVVEWRKDSGDVPGGIALDVGAGVFSGNPTTEEIDKALYHGYDAAGNRIARAEIHFSVFEPVGTPVVIDFYSHTGTYFFDSIPDPDGVTVHTWVPVPGYQYADGMSMLNSGFQGTPTKTGVYDVAWRGYDYMGREVAFAYGTFTAADGPIVEELLADGSIRTNIGDQIADKTKNQIFSVKPIVQRSLGQVTYKLLPTAARPSGLAFSSQTGVVGNVYDDFETTASFRIEARDSHDGTTGLSNAFSLTTLPSEIMISLVPNLSGIVGVPYYRKLNSLNVIGGATWTVLQGKLPDGIKIDPQTGTLSGTPTKVEEQTDLVIGVSGPAMIPDQSNTFSFRIWAEGVNATTNAKHVRIDTPFTTDGVTVTKGGGGANGVTVTAQSGMPGGVTIDGKTGVMTAAAGIPVAGDYDTSLLVENEDRSRTIFQILRVYNPLEISYANGEAKRLSDFNLYPTIASNSIIGSPKLTLVDTTGAARPKWLNFNNVTGRIYGRPWDTAEIGTVYGPFVVTLADDQDSINSDPFTITVKDRDAIEVEVRSRDVERFVPNAYTLVKATKYVGNVSYSVTTTPSNWPSTLSISSDGMIRGTSDDPIGTVYSGLVITATDSENYTTPSASIDLTVVEPKALAPLTGSLNKTFEWTAGMAFTGTLPGLSNGYGKLAYSFDPSSPNVSITDPLKGAFGGTIATPGTYTLTFKIDDETDRLPASGTLTITINEPLTATADPEYTLNRASVISGLHLPTVTGGTQPYTMTFTGQLPPNVFFTNGVFSGTPSTEGTFPVVVTVTDKAGDVKISTFNLKVDPPLDFKVTYTTSTALLVGQTTPDGVLLAPTIENALKGTVNWISVTGDLPPGIDFLDGKFVGTPLEAGKWPGIVVEAEDGEGRKSVATITISVSLSGDIEFSDATIRHRTSTQFDDTVSADNVVDPAKYASVNVLPGNLVLNPATGKLTGSFTAEGSYPITITVTDDMDRTATAVVTYEIVGDLSIAASDVALDQYVDPASPAPAVATNALGALVYSLKSGTLPDGLSIDSATGAVVGAATENGTFDNIVILAIDTDGQTAESTPFSVAVSPRKQLEISAPGTLTLKRYEDSSFAAATLNEIPIVSFEINPALPSGLSLDKASGAISGSSDELVTPTAFTLKATDSKGGTLGTAEKGFTLEVIERDQLEVTFDSIAAKRYAPIIPVTAIVTPGTAVGAVTYTVSPTLPDGLSLVDGTISGTPTDVVPSTTYKLTAVDAKGGALGTDEVDFTLAVADRDALGIDGADPFEFVQFSQDQALYPALNAIGTTTFSISPALPEGLELDTSTGTISGTPKSKMDPTPYTLMVTDSYDTTQRQITLSVGDRKPLKITNSDTQALILDAAGYALTLATENAVGDVTFEHVSGDLPEGIDFDATTGTFSGTATEFGIDYTVGIRATDPNGGDTTKIFTFKVQQDGTPITVTVSPAVTRIGQPFSIDTPVTANTVGNVNWTAQTGTTGLSVDPLSGKLSGTPTSIFTQNVIVTVKDITGRDMSAVIEASSVPKISVTAPAEIEMTYNRDVPVGSGATATDTVGTVAWSYTGTLPKGLGFDTATGMFTGKPKEIGTFGPIRVTAADTLPGTTTSGNITIKVKMNGDPIELSVTNFLTKIGYPVLTALPVYDNELGPVTFFSTDISGTNLSISPTTGVLSGTPNQTLDRFINVAIRDRDTTRVTSMPLHMQVIPLMQITLPSQIAISALTDITPVAPTRNYVVGAATWEPLDESVNKLPDGITFDTTTGTFGGNATVLGTFGPFTVASTDSLGDRGVSNPFTIKVSAGAFFLGLADAALPDATKRISTYSYDFKQNMTHVGMDESEITWSLGVGAPPGLSISNGVLSGTPALSGTFTFPVTAKYDKITATRMYTLVVNLPTIALTLNASDVPDAKRRRMEADNTYSFDFKPLVQTTNINLSDVTFSVEPGIPADKVTPNLPAGLTIVDGVLQGLTDAPAGAYSFTVRASFKHATDENISSATVYTITVVDEIAFAYNTALITGPKKRLSYTFDLGSLIDTATMKNVKLSQLAWEWTPDLLVNPSATLPAGLNLSGSSISGTPVNSGTYPVTLKTSFDGRSVSKSFTLQIDLQQTTFTLSTTNPDAGEIQKTYTTDLKNLLTTTNIPKDQVKWTVSSDVTLQTNETAGIPVGFALNGNTGVLSGSTTAKGTYRFSTKATWDETNATAEHADATQVYVIVINGVTYKFTQIAAGETHTCGVTTDDGVKCWGTGTTGQLGNSGTANSSLPVDVTGLTSGVSKVTAGTNFSCALTTTGTVKCWGAGTLGQLGNSASVSTNAPVNVTGISGATAIASSRYHTCVVDSAGGIKCWGRNDDGQLGDGGTSNHSAPVQVSGLTSGYQSVAAGSMHACALSNSGGVKCWGNNGGGQLGNGTRGGGVNLPVDVDGMTSGVKLVVGGTSHTCAVTTAGEAKCWGPQTSGRIGNNTSTGYAMSPTLVTGLGSGVSTIAAGSTHSCAVMQSGTVKCWGSGSNGELGNGGSGTALSPVDVSNITTATTISVNNAHSCSVLSTGEAKCWGAGTGGMLGNGLTTTQRTPVSVGG